MSTNAELSIDNNLRRKLSSEMFKEKKQDESSTDDEEQYDVDQYKTFDFTNKEMLHHISDIYSLCKETCNPKYLSVLLYMSCRHVGFSWRQTDDFLKNIGAMSIVSSHYHSQTFLNEDLSYFKLDGRGGKRGSDFWDEHSKLEIMARQFAVEGCNRKSANFTVQELAKYVDEKFYELTGLTKLDDHFVRTIESYRLDLRKWGIRYGTNKTLPYFLGHERLDVVEHRERFIKCFLSGEDSYYRISEEE